MGNEEYIAEELLKDVTAKKKKKNLLAAQEALEECARTDNPQYKETLKNTALLKLYELTEGYLTQEKWSEKYDAEYDLWCKLLNEVIEKYDPQTGPLENYVNRVWLLRRKTLFPKDEEKHKRKVPVIISLDDSLGGGGQDGSDESISYHEVIGDTNNAFESIETIIAAKEFVVEIGRLLSEYQERSIMQNGVMDSRKTEKNKWYRLFFTEMVTSIVKGFLIDQTKRLEHEQQTFKQMNCRFLDFYMNGECRGFVPIWVTPLKLNREFDLKDPDEELRLPLNTVVWKRFVMESEEMSHLAEESIAAVLSKRRKEYYGLITPYREELGL